MAREDYVVIGQAASRRAGAKQLFITSAANKEKLYAGSSSAEKCNDVNQVVDSAYYLHQSQVHELYGISVALIDSGDVDSVSERGCIGNACYARVIDAHRDQSIRHFIGNRKDVIDVSKAIFLGSLDHARIADEEIERSVSPGLPDRAYHRRIILRHIKNHRNVQTPSDADCSRAER